VRRTRVTRAALASAIAAAAVVAFASVAGAGNSQGNGKGHEYEYQYQYGGQPKVVMCHHTGSKSNPTVTIIVAAPAVRAHLRHGDTLGPCPGPGAPPRGKSGEKHHGPPSTKPGKRHAG
jgi:hypothetical protein